MSAWRQRPVPRRGMEWLEVLVGYLYACIGVVETVRATINTYISGKSFDIWTLTL